jgi:small-conductance mechanosensitive channel
MKKFFPIIVLFLSLAFPPLAVADDMQDMEKMSGQLKKVNSKISRGQFDGEDLSAWTKLTINMKSKASLCVSNSEASLIDLKASIEGLGEKVKGEDVEVTKKRSAFEKKKAELDKVLAKCNLFIVSSNEVANIINEAEKSYFKQKYLAKSPDIIELTMIYLENPVSLLQESGKFIYSGSGIFETGLIEMLLGTFAVVISVLLGIWVRKRLLALESKRQWLDDFTESMFRAMLTTLSRSAPYLLGSATAAIISVALSWEEAEFPFVTELLIGLVIFFLSTSVVRLLFSPYPPAERFIPLTPHIAEALSKRLRILILLSLIGYLAFYTAFSDNIIESHLLLMRNIFSLFVVVNLVWTLQVIVKSPKLPKLRYISIFVIIVVALSLVAEWMGYRNLAFGSRQLVLFSFLALMLFIGISKLFKDLFDAIDDGSYGWCRSLQKTLGVEKGEKVPGLIWIRLLATIVIWGGFAILFINAWDYSGGLIEQIRGYIVHGFDIGDFRIIPGRILWALLIFGSIFMVSSWVKSQMENNWLKLTSMGQGARDAVVTITGYVMFLIAILAGLSAAGFNFGNIAIIAGALSVGIGFGLQNIVNNFVSGLILLFERPVRKGDWIMVGGTEGYVKDIQIRSTRIQTFDRSDVIVPNSELISNQVTNWVLSSRYGRAIIPIGVAYGTDVERVREILYEIVEDMPEVVKSGIVPKPKVLFREFGDSSLNFELRVFLNNIDNRLSAISEINFAIDKAFKEHGIEIPFPQRDLHVKSLPDGFTGDSRKDDQE